MKCTYKGCDVEVVTPLDSAAGGAVTPSIEISRSDPPKIHLWLNTGKSFPTVEEAEEFALQVAHAWIDKNGDPNTD